MKQMKEVVKATRTDCLLVFDSISCYGIDLSQLDRRLA